MTSPKLAPDTRVRAASKVFTRPLGEERVLLDFANGEYFALDPIGAYVWEQMAMPRSIGEMAKSIVDRYDVTYDHALRDIVSLVTELLQKSLATIEPA